MRRQERREVSGVNSSVGSIYTGMPHRKEAETEGSHAIQARAYGIHFLLFFIASLASSLVLVFPFLH